jgi:Ca2+-binding EF-hand superfamily protein
VKLLSGFQDQVIIDKTYYKIYKKLNGKLTWKEIFARYEKEGNLIVRTRGHKLHRRDIKVILKRLKLGLSEEEISAFLHSFDLELVTYQEVDAKIEEAVRQIEGQANEELLVIHSIIEQLHDQLQIQGQTMDRLFFDFDTDGNGTL